MPDLEIGAPKLLGETLARLREVQQDPAWVAATEAAAAEAERFETAQRAANSRSARAANLARERVPLRRHIEAAIVDGGPMSLPTLSFERVERWMGKGDVPPVLVLSGGTGCGKSVAAAWALAQSGGRWRTAQQLWRLFANQFGEELLAEQNAVTRCRLLVIDDVGTETDAVRMASTLLELIENRQHSAQRHRTIITTNMTRDEFLGRYAAPGGRATQNERLASRFDRKAKIVAWSFDPGPDLRRGA